MNELYLHQLWKLKRLPFHLLATTDHQTLIVLDVGEYNMASGPDFFNGQIEVDGMRLVGNIEMHLKSSDWYVHGHQNDRAYDNVILHVVLQHDKPVFVNGKELLTLELGDFVHWLGNELPAFSATKIACSDQIADSVKLSEQLDHVLRARLERKSRRFFSSKYQIQVFFETFAESFGRKTNAIPFLNLAQNVKIEFLLRCSSHQQKAIVLGMSGIDDFKQEQENWKQEWIFLKSCHQLHELDPVVWKMKGNRPASFPQNRLLQLASIISKIDWLYPFWEDSENDIISYWKTILTVSTESKKMSDDFVDHILINAIVPYIYFQGNHQNNPKLRTKALNILKSIRQEKNMVILSYKKLGLKITNGYQTQALLEQNRNWCSAKKCLDCLVGKELLNQTQNILKDYE